MAAAARLDRGGAAGGPYVEFIHPNDRERTVAEASRLASPGAETRDFEIRNLMANALKFTAGEPPVVRIGAEREGERWRVFVADEGIGIEPRYADRIFQVFQRLHTPDEYAGTGIGLAICRTIVKRHGGTIGVESVPGEGSTFSFTLPAA